MLRVWAFKEKQGSITETKQALATKMPTSVLESARNFQLLNKKLTPEANVGQEKNV